MTRENNRLSMPTVAALVDEIRAQGFGCKVIYASENGKTLGEKPKDENIFQIPPGYRIPTAKAGR